MQIGIGLSITNQGAGGFTPSTLGTLLLGWWDAERSDLITQSGNLVSSWKDSVAAYNLTGSTTARPTYGAASFNSRPGLTFDGVANMLSMASVPFPTGASPCEIWVLVDQTALPADTGDRCIFAYGGGGSSSARRAFRVVRTGVNRAEGDIGNGTTAVGATNTSVDFSGRNVARYQVGATTSQTDVNGTVGSGATVTPATGTTTTAIGSTDTGSTMFKGVIASVLVTSPLSSSQAALLTTYLKARGGIA